MKYSVSRSNSLLKGELSISPSKTIGNKVLQVRVLKSAHLSQHIANENDDAHIVNHNLFSGGLRRKNGDVYKSVRYIRAVMRYFGGEWLLSSSDILRGRSAFKIVKILKRFALNVNYEARTGRPPIKLTGKNMRGNVMRFDGMISSKMLEIKFIFPSTTTNETISKLKDTVINSSYITMSLRAIQQLGVNTDWNLEDVLIEHEIIDGSELVIEADWSIVSYIYQMVALSKRAKLTINGLNNESIQPEFAVKDIFASLGVESELFDNCITIKRSGHAVKVLTHNFKNYPDLVPAVVVTCVCRNIPFSITGADILRKKEVDRIVALQTELQKLGATIISQINDDGCEVLTFNGKSNVGKIREVEFETYNDHRVAIALSLVSAIGIKVMVQNPLVANKSFFNFWDDIKKLGFTIEVF